MNPDVEEFRQRLERILARTNLFPGQSLHVDVILNPHAGALLHRKRRKKLLVTLRSWEASRVAPGPSREVKVTTWTTEYPGHEKAILSHLNAVDPCRTSEIRLVVTAGGDGTSRGALVSALTLNPEVRANMIFFRLPLGTGNDAADVLDFSSALALLCGDQASQVCSQPVIEVLSGNQEPHFSFNIASAGLDAFVVHLTNRLKAWFPGNSYSLMVDVATLFYEVFVRVVPIAVDLSQGGKKVLSLHQKFLLIAMGASGHRTYGAGKRILPDADNVCLVGSRNLFTKLAYRKPFYSGTHRGLDGVTLSSGDEIQIQIIHPVPIQMDGEVLWLDATDSPVVFNVSERGLRVLTLADSETHL